MRFPLAEQIVIIDQRMTLVASDTQSPWWSGGKQNWLMPSWMDSARNQTPIVADSSKRHLTGVSLPFVALKQTFPRRRQMTNGARDWPNRRVTQRRETLWSTSQLTTVPHFRWNVHLHNSFTSAFDVDGDNSGTAEFIITSTTKISSATYGASTAASQPPLAG